MACGRSSHPLSGDDDSSWFAGHAPGFGRLRRNALGIPDPWRLHAVVPIGHPQAGGHGPLARKPVSAMAYHDRWGEAYRELVGD
ncbi:MAG: hypothetical protein R3F21_18200 [Myxococcota bacterium]